MSNEKCYVLIKRGLYWGPNFRGYTSDIRKAGRYTLEEASSREYPHDEPVTKRLISEIKEGKAMLEQEQELATLRAKAEAFDKGHDAWAVFNSRNSLCRLAARSERLLKEKWLDLTPNLLSEGELDHLWRVEEESGFTCRKVRVCEEVKQPNEKGE